MPFTIEMAAPAWPDSESRHSALATELIGAFPAIAVFPLDHDLIARDVVHVPRGDVLKRGFGFASVEDAQRKRAEHAARLVGEPPNHQASR
jgi:hypothetical protein